jgi:hypothetical protein
MNDCLEYRRSSSAHIAKLTCLVLLFACQSHLRRETKETKGQSVQMIQLSCLAMVPVRQRGNQSNVRRRRWIKELQYIVYTVPLLLAEQRPHPVPKEQLQTTHTTPQKQKGRSQKGKRNCRESNPESSPTCPFLSSRIPSIQWGRPDSNAGRDFSDALAIEPQLLFVTVCEVCETYVGCFDTKAERKICSE